MSQILPPSSIFQEQAAVDVLWDKYSLSPSRSFLWPMQAVDATCGTLHTYDVGLCQLLDSEDTGCGRPWDTGRASTAARVFLFKLIPNLGRAVGEKLFIMEKFDFETVKNEMAERLPDVPIDVLDNILFRIVTDNTITQNDVKKLKKHRAIHVFLDVLYKYDFPGFEAVKNGDYFGGLDNDD